MALKRNKESPSGPGKDPEAKPKVVVSDAEPKGSVDPIVTKTATSGSGSGGDGGKSSGGPFGGGGGGKRKNETKQNPFTESRQFLKEVAIEFRKISWPEFRQVVRETWSVLFLVAIITLMVLGFDWVLSHFVFGPLEHFARIHGGGIGSN